jgi:hypothetical protein
VERPGVDSRQADLPQLADVRATAAERAQELEVKPLPKLAVVALRELQTNINKATDEVIAESAELLGITPDQGWQYNAQALRFERPKKPA